MMVPIEGDRKVGVKTSNIKYVCLSRNIIEDQTLSDYDIRVICIIRQLCLAGKTNKLTWSTLKRRIMLKLNGAHERLFNCMQKLVNKGLINWSGDIIDNAVVVEITGDLAKTWRLNDPELLFNGYWVTIPRQLVDRPLNILPSEFRALLVLQSWAIPSLSWTTNNRYISVTKEVCYDALTGPAGICNLRLKDMVSRLPYIKRAKKDIHRKCPNRFIIDWGLLLEQNLTPEEFAEIKDEVYKHREIVYDMVDKVDKWKCDPKERPRRGKKNGNCRTIATEVGTRSETVQNKADPAICSDINPGQTTTAMATKTPQLPLPRVQLPVHGGNGTEENENSLPGMHKLATMQGDTVNNRGKQFQIFNHKEGIGLAKQSSDYIRENFHDRHDGGKEERMVEREEKEAEDLEVETQKRRGGIPQKSVAVINGLKSEEIKSPFDISEIKKRVLNHREQKNAKKRINRNIN